MAMNNLYSAVEVFGCRKDKTETLECLVEIIKSTLADLLISKHHKMRCIHDKPEVIQSDNGISFQSTEFGNYAKW